MMYQDRLGTNIRQPAQERCCFVPRSGAMPNKPLLIELVHFERQLQLADDGCFVETGGPTSAHMRFNWCTGSGKEGLRFDGTCGSVFRIDSMPLQSKHPEPSDHLPRQALDRRLCGRLMNDSVNNHITLYMQARMLLALRTVR